MNLKIVNVKKIINQYPYIYSMLITSGPFSQNDKLRNAFKCTRDFLFDGLQT